MQISLIIFRIKVDRFSALAIDMDRRQPWRREYSSIHALVEDLREAGIASGIQTDELERELLDQKPLPMLTTKVDLWDLEDAGFVRVAPLRPV